MKITDITYLLLLISFINFEIATKGPICKPSCLKSSFEISKKLAPVIFIFFKIAISSPLRKRF
jgi:hypothetical protein